ncbi:MAG: hypothetical protein IJZ42_13065 [Lachnospiraceae bacterium]|nr:hypothetical protein [Lachnospiraceae bacterium]
MKPNPCYKCPKRTAICHSNCPDYDKFVAENEIEKAQKNKEKQFANDFIAARKSRFKNK